MDVSEMGETTPSTLMNVFTSSTLNIAYCASCKIHLIVYNDKNNPFSWVEYASKIRNVTLKK